MFIFCESAETVNLLNGIKILLQWFICIIISQKINECIEIYY